MFSRTFTYPGFDGQKHEDTWSFNLSDAEIFEMNLGSVGGISGVMNRMMREEHPEKLVEMFKTLILKSVGERSMDGRRFIKKERPGMPWGEVAEEFKETPAYAELFVELVSSGEKLKEFIMKAIPEETAKKIMEAEKASAMEKAAVSEVSGDAETNIVSIPTGSPEGSDN